MWGLLPALVLLTAGSAVLQVPGEGPGPEPGFSLPLGERGALEVMDDGSFRLVDGETVLAGSSHWSVRVSDRVQAPGTEAYRSALVAPLHRAGDTLTMVFYEDGVLTELAYQAAGATAVLTVTTVNRWQDLVNVTFRCALDLSGMGISAGEAGVLEKEAAFSPGGFSQLSGHIAGAERFSCVLPEAPETVAVVSSARSALDSEWHVGVNGQLPLGDEAGVAVFWPRQTLGPAEFSRVRLLLSAGPARPVAIPQNDLWVDQFGVVPVAAHEHDERRVAFSVRNGGPAADTQATVLFMLEGLPFSMKFMSIHVEWNRTVWTELDWAPATAGNYTVVLILPLFGDRSPADNLRTQAADVLVDPYEFNLRFSTSGNESSCRSFPGAGFKVQMYIQNTGTSPDAYEVSLKGVPEGWTARLGNANLSLMPGKLSYFWLSVQTAGNARYDNYTFQVRARSFGSGEMRRLTERVEIGPPPPPGENRTQPGYYPLLPAEGNDPPPAEIRPYEIQDDSGSGWFPKGDRSRLAYTALGVLGVAAAAAILGVAVYQASRMHAINVFRRIIKRALYGLATGDELRQVIYEAYRKMCSQLEKLGYTREDHVTPTEFARALRLALPLDTRSIRMLTGLFEEARYSDHRLSEADREAAMESLRYIESELDKLTTFVEEEGRLGKLRKRIRLGET